MSIQRLVIAFMSVLLSLAWPVSAQEIPLQGPGLGNLTYTEAELFQPISMIRAESEGGDVPPHAGYSSLAYGAEVGGMVNGYFVAMFAPDSGVGTGGFLVYDVSNPRAPVLKQKIYEPTGRTKGFKENHIFSHQELNGRDYVAVPTVTGVEIWDFTDINNIQQTKVIALPGVAGGGYDNVTWQSFWQGSYLYVSVANYGLYIIDAKDPANAVVADRGQGRPNPIPVSELGGFRMGTILAMGNLMFASANNSDGFTTLDASDPLNPRVLVTQKVGRNSYSMCFDGKKAYTASLADNQRIHGFDLTDPRTFVAEGSTLAKNRMLYCATQDNFLFEGTETKIHKIDATNPASYVDVGEGNLDIVDLSHSDHGQVSPMSNIVYVGNDHGSGSGFIVHQTAPDTTPPAVRGVSPLDTAKFQATTSRVGLGMTDTVLSETVNAQTFIVRPVGGQPLAGVYSAQNGLINFTPAAPLLPGTSYEVVLPANGIKDLAGNAIATEFKSTFTTRAVDNGLVHHWPLTSDLQDAVRASNGTASGSDVFADGGLDFSTRTGGVTLASTAVSDILGSTSSLSMFLKTTQTTTKIYPWETPGIFGRDDASAASGYKDITWGWLDSAGYMNLSTGMPGVAGNPGTKTAAPVNDGKWHHVVMTRDATTGVQTVYLDGVKTTTTGTPGVMGSGAKFNLLGQVQGNADFFKGVLTDVQVYDRVLTDAEVSALRGSRPVPLEPLLIAQAKQFNPAELGISGASYVWNFGDGTTVTTTAASPIATHTYAAPGHYTVTALVKQADGSENTHSFLLTVNRPLTAAKPTNSTNITGDATAVYSVNPDSGTVSAIDAQTLAKLWEVPVGAEPQTLAIGPGGTIWVAVYGDDKLVGLRTNGTIATTVNLDYGSGPHGIAFTPDGTKGVVTLESKSAVAIFNPVAGTITQTVSLPAGSPRGVAVTGDSKTAYITRFKSKMTNGEVYKLDLATLAAPTIINLAIDTTSADTEASARGIPNYLHQVVISPDGVRAVLPSKKDNIVAGMFRDGTKLLPDTSIRSILSQVDLATGAELVNEQIDFNDSAPSRAATFSPLGDYIFIAQMEGNRISIADAYSGTPRGEISNPGTPQGLYLDATRNRLFVNDFLGRSVTVHEVSPILSSESTQPTLVGTTPTVATEPLTAAVLAGKKIFYNAADTRMSRENYISCASCHVDGGDDGIVWDFTQRGEGLRRTISLQGRQGLAHGNAHWTANFDEIQDFEHDIRKEFGGTGFSTDAVYQARLDPLGVAFAGQSAELDQLAAYVTSLNKYPRSPALNAQGCLTPEAVAGKATYDKANCVSCHAGATLRDGLRHDVGTVQPSSGTGISKPLANVGFDTPTLFGVWDGGPYLHNGQAATLNDIFASGTHATGVPAAEVPSLVTYLRSLDERNMCPTP